MRTVLLTPLLIGFVANGLPAAILGYYTFDDDGGTAGGAISTVTNAINPGTNDSISTVGSPVYTALNPGGTVWSPVTGLPKGNSLAFDASANNSRVRLPPAMISGLTEFTIEFWMYLRGEPGGFHSFLRGRDSTFTVTSPPASRMYRNFQIDFDHGNNVNNYGELRARFDTYDGATQTSWNRVSRVNAGKLLVDTNGGDGMVSSYTGSDPSTNGDGLNDIGGWHHVGLTFDGTRFRTYLDGAAGTNTTLNGTFVAPDGFLEFGKISNSGYGLFIDNLMIHDVVLSPAQFMTVPEPSRALLVGLGAATMLLRRRRS